MPNIIASITMRKSTNVASWSVDTCARTLGPSTHQKYSAPLSSTIDKMIAVSSAGILT